MLMFALALAATARPADPASVFKAYEAAVAAGDGAAIAALVGDDPVPTPFAMCPPSLDNRACLIDYLNRTVVTTHSVITPINVSVDGDTVTAKLELRNDLTRAAGVERVAGADRITVVGGKIVGFAFVRDEGDVQTRAFFDYMRRTMGPPPGGMGPPPGGDGPPPGAPPR